MKEAYGFISFRFGAQFSRDGEPHDPHEVRCAEVYDSLTGKLLDRTHDMQHVPGTGLYYISQPTEYTPVYEVTWYFTWEQGGEEETIETLFEVQTT